MFFCSLNRWVVPVERRMMELSSEKSNGGTLHHPFVYPTDLRVLGYAAGVIPPSPTSATVQIIPPLSPNASSHHMLNSTNGSFTLPRNLIFSDSEVLFMFYFTILICLARVIRHRKQKREGSKLPEFPLKNHITNFLYLWLGSEGWCVTL